MTDTTGGVATPALKPFWWPDVQGVIAVSIIGLFAAVYLQNPGDDTMKGALIAAFAGAWGYYLGSSSGAKSANARADKSADAVSNLALAAASPVSSTVTTTTDITSGKDPATK